MAINRDDESSEDDEAVFDWKKNGFDKNERLSLRINAKEADNYNARKKNQPLKANRPENLAAGLKKIRKKIREVYDDDEDDDENGTIFAPIQYAKEEENPLLNALNEDEKRLFYQKQNIENVNMQQTAGKMEALHIANNLARESGLKDISRKAMAAGMQEATFRPEEIQEKVIKKEVSGKLGIKGKIEDGKIISAARGIKKIESLGGKEAAKNSPLTGEASLHVVYGEDFSGRELETLCRQADAVVDLTGEGKSFQSLFGAHKPVYDKADLASAAEISRLPFPAEDVQAGYWSRKKAAGLLGKEVILGVTSVWNDQKGLSDFVKLAGMLTERQQLVMIGLTKSQLEALPPNIMGMERTANVQELAMYYGIADYFLNLTYQDTYPTTNLEAISCGTPVITYETGGSPESAGHFGACVPRGDVTAAAKLILEHPCFQKEDWDCDNAVFLKKQMEIYK